MKIDKWFHLYGRKDDIVFEEVPFEALPSAQQWIPCSERLPEKQTTILATDFGEVQMAYINDEGRWMDFYGNKLKNVTAWMPLPEPYKEEIE